MNSCSVVIATLDRVERLKDVLVDLAQQTRPPGQVIISAAGNSSATLSNLASEFSTLPIELIPNPEKSAAKQRNAAADRARGDVIAFLDDDIRFSADLFEQILAFFDQSEAIEIGAIAPRVGNVERSAPGLIARMYYFLQSGYWHKDYGAKLFGPCINCYPVYDNEKSNLISAQWLPSTCLFMRAEFFKRHRFPEFSGYSFAEDVHLTARVARETGLFFLKNPAIRHDSAPSEFKKDAFGLTSKKLSNMREVARDVMGLSPGQLFWRWHAHKIFTTIGLLRSREPERLRTLQGIWIRSQHRE